MRAIIFIGVASLLLGQSVRGADRKVFVSLLDDTIKTRVGPVIEDGEKEIAIRDLKEGREFRIAKDQAKKIERNVTDEAAVRIAGLPSVVAWRVAESASREVVVGRVAQITQNVIYLTLGESTGIHVGQKYDVFRKATEIRDPETKQVLGVERPKIGVLEVTEVQKNYSKGKLVSEIEVGLQAGDEVEPQAGRMRIAVLPFRAEESGLTEVGASLAEDLTTRLVQLDMTVLERAVLDRVLAEQSLQNTALFEPDQVQRLGQLAGASTVLTGKFVVKGKLATAYVRLVDVRSGKIEYAVSGTMSVATEGTEPVAKSKSNPVDSKRPLPKGAFRSAVVDVTEKTSPNWIFKQVRSGALIQSDRGYALTAVPKEMQGASLLLRDSEDCLHWLEPGHVTALKGGTAYILIRTHYLGKEEIDEIMLTKFAREGWEDVPNQEWLWPKGTFQNGMHTSGSSMFALRATTMFSGKGVEPVIVSLSPTGELSTVGDERVFGVNDAPSRRMLRASDVECVAGLEGFLAAGCSDGVVRLWEPFDDVARQAPSREFRGARGEIRAVALSLKHIACINLAGETVVWNRRESAIKVVAKEKVQAATPATATSGDQLFSLELITNEQRYVVRRNSDRKVIANLPPGLLLTYKFSPHGKYLVVYYPIQVRPLPPTYAARMVLWDLTADKEIKSQRLPPDSYSSNFSLDNPFSSDDRYFALAKGEEVSILECATGRVKGVVKPPEFAGFCLNRTGSKLAVGDLEAIRIFDVETQAMVAEIAQGYSPKVFDDSGEYLIAAKVTPDPGNSDVISIKLATKEVSTLYLGKGEYTIRDVGFSSDGRRIFVATDGKLVVRATDDGSLLVEIPFSGIPDVKNCDELVMKLIDSWQ